MNQVDTIWLVDDDEVYQYITTAYINMANVCNNVASFTKAEDALNELQNGNYPDIILLDINMPTMDGWMFLEAYLKIQPNINHTINIFLVTSSIDNKDREKSKTYTCIKDFITKPIDDNTITELVQMV